MAIDWHFIEELEGFATVGYVPTDADGEPLGKSGVTIGGGVDLRYWREDKLRKRGVPESIVTKLSPYMGLGGRDAVFVAPQLVLTEGEAQTLTVKVREVILDALMRRFDRASNHFCFYELPEAVQTVIASVAFQYGPNLASATPQFWEQVTGGLWRRALANLEDFRDKYPTRRKKEAALLRSCLANPPKKR